MWTETRLKFLSDEPIVNGLGEAGAYEESAWPRYVRTTDIAGSRSLRADTFASLPPEIARGAPLRLGDILMTAAGTIGKSYLHQTDEPACYAGYLVRFRARSNVEPRFVAYWTESVPYWDQIRAGRVISTIENFSAGKYRNLRLRIPSFAVQHLIADFLDAETARIDALIEKKRRLSVLLRERLVVTALQLVFGRGAEYADRKPSRIDCVGDVPAHWRVVRNKTFMKEMTEVSVWGDEELLTVSHLTGVTPRAEKEVNMFMAESLKGYKVVRRGDLVVNTMWAWMGALGVSPCAGIASPSYGVYSIDPNQAEPLFVDALFRSPPYVAEITRLSTGVWTSRLRLYPEALLSMRTPLPPKEEQAGIANRLKELKATLGRQAARLDQSVDLLLERRQALITAAVTGRLDVAKATA